MVQSILTVMEGRLLLSDCVLHGNFISADGQGSVIELVNTVDLRNGDASLPNCDPVDGYPPNDNGVPLCNPFNPFQECSTHSATNGGAIAGEAQCLENAGGR